MNSKQIRTWAEISLDNLEHNFNEIKKRLPDGCRFLATVKADAYGHGAEMAAKLYEKLGADYFSVACFDEARQLRQHTKLPILILGYTPPEMTDQLIALGITQTVNSLETAVLYSERAIQTGGRLKVHIAADTGMGRLGFNCRQDSREAESIYEAVTLPGLDAEGIFTHFAVSDVLGKDNDAFTRKQYDNFCSVILKLEREYGWKFALRHCANSGALLNCKYTYSGIMNMVRPGIILYGLYPGKEKGDMLLRPVMQLKTRIAQIQTLEEGASVSYGRTWTSPGSRKIAVLPIGYADGFFRTFSNKREVLLHGKRIPLIGKVCMDMTMADITDIEDARVGDTVTIFGYDCGSFLPIEELAETAGTISYELVCAVAARVPRVYISHGSIAGDI